MDRKGKTNCGSTHVREFVTVAFAEDMELAEQYQALLEENEIDAQIKRQPEMVESGFSGIAIQVTEDFLDEAHALISEKASYNDFFDMILDDQDRDQFDYSDLQIDDEDYIY